MSVLLSTRPTVLRTELRIRHLKRRITSDKLRNLHFPLIMRVAIIDASLRSLSVELAGIRLNRNHADALLSRMAEDGEIEG